MRIISQNGEHDVPYNQCVFWIDKSKNIIYATPIGEIDTLLPMAIYSRYDKIEKAVRKLHNQYQEGQSNTIFRFPKENEI